MMEEFEEAGYTGNPRIPESAHRSRRQKKEGGGVRLSERAMQARARVRIGVGSSLALRKATNHSEKARGTQFMGRGVEMGQQAGLDKGRACFKIWWSHTWCYSKVWRIPAVRRTNWCCPGTAGPFPAPEGRSAGEVGDEEWDCRREWQPTETHISQKWGNGRWGWTPCSRNHRRYRQQHWYLDLMLVWAFIRKQMLILAAS